MTDWHENQAVIYEQLHKCSFFVTNVLFFGSKIVKYIKDIKKLLIIRINLLLRQISI